MKNPLNRRLTRELKGELGKYLVILILLIATIGFVSGFLVADGSMLTAYNESFEKYNIEDGHFTVVKQMNKAQKKNVEALGVTLYDLILIDHTVLWYRLKLSLHETPEKVFGKNRNGSVFKPEDRNFSRVSSSGDLSEYQQLSGALFVGVVLPICCCFWNAPAVCAGSLSDGIQGRTCWRNTSTYAFGSGKCLFRK